MKAKLTETVKYNKINLLNLIFKTKNKFSNITVELVKIQKWLVELKS